MQTQSIFPNVSAVQMQSGAKTSDSASKAQKVSKSGFDSYMSKGSAKSGEDSCGAVRKASGETEVRAEELGQTREGFQQNKIAAADEQGAQDSGEAVELETAEAKVVQLLQDVFGMSEEEMTDILEQLGVTPIDLVLFIAQMPDTQAQVVQAVNTEGIRALIMEVHGTEDENLFLVSDKMSGEFTELVKGIQGILAEEFGVNPDQLSEEDNALLQSFAETIAQVGEVSDETVQSQELQPVRETEVADAPKQLVGADAERRPIEQKVLDGESQTDAQQTVQPTGRDAADVNRTAQQIVAAEENAIVEEPVYMEQTVVPEVLRQEAAGQETVVQTKADEMAVTELGHEIPVVVEVSEKSGTNGALQSDRQNVGNGRTGGEPASPISAFVEHLTESFEAVRQDDPALARQVTMDRIVEQVVNHVRIRVLPQTTSMELQLNPASLGRVNLNVTSQNGTATATLTVQTQVAKEALESQLTVLRENLESQGLKVEAVEVNVSEFGFKHPEDSNSNQYQQKKSSQNRRFRVHAGSEAEERETAGAEMVTSADRRDGSSVVDYTA